MAVFGAVIDKGETIIGVKCVVLFPLLSLLK